MNGRDILKTTALSMLVTTIVLGSFAASASLDLTSKVMAVAVSAVMTGAISALLGLIYVFLRKR